MKVDLKKIQLYRKQKKISLDELCNEIDISRTTIWKWKKNKSFPNISLPNQEGNLLRLYRLDTFRMVLYFFPMTGRPDRSLPDNWNNIPGAKGCTIQTCLFRDNYDEIISLS